MANLRGADEDGVVVEMIKYTSNSFKDILWSFYNQRLLDCDFDESWHTTILQMLPKDWDLNELANWQPIAILPIFYKIFAKLIYNRIASRLFQVQSFDQHGFTPGIHIEDVILCAAIAIEYHEEFNMPLWILSMGMRKTFDTIDHSVLMRALRLKGLPTEYVSVLSILYTI